jgi:hypothetical protein
LETLCSDDKVTLFLKFFGGNGVRTQGFVLEMLYQSKTLSSPLVILETGSCSVPMLAWTVILLFYTSHHSWNDRHMLHAQLF